MEWLFWCLAARSAWNDVYHWSIIKGFHFLHQLLLSHNELDKEEPTANGSALWQAFLLEDGETSKLNCCLMQSSMSQKKKKRLQAKSHPKKQKWWNLKFKLPFKKNRIRNDWASFQSCPLVCFMEATGEKVVFVIGQLVWTHLYQWQVPTWDRWAECPETLASTEDTASFRYKWTVQRVPPVHPRDKWHAFLFASIIVLLLNSNIAPRKTCSAVL